MTLTSYQIRNEYGLADKELYQAADKEDPEAFLETASMAGLVGVLRQLGDLAEFAAKVFHCLHEELMTTAARGHGLAMRLQQLEADFSSIEIPILSQINHSTFYYDPGLEWHSNLQTEENLIAPRNFPHCIMDSYEECRGPPQLFLLDKFDVAGSGSCLKRYSDPSLLKMRAASAVVATTIHSKDERPRKQKKEGSHTTSKETHGDSQTSHAKLHQLFFLEHVENGHRNPEFHVKLKRRQLNGPPINSSSGISYMEKFLKKISPYSERVNGTLDQSSPVMETDVTVCSIREDLQIPSPVYPNNEDNEMEMDSIADDERLKIPFFPHEITVSEKSLPNIVGRPVVCLERSSCVNLHNKANNDTDAPASTESDAKEAESDDKAGCDFGFPGFGQTQICANAEVTQTEVLAHFSDVLHHSPVDGESSVLCTDIQKSSPESKPHKAEGSAVKVEDHSQHVFSVETESEISLSALVEDQFSSITNQEIEALEPKDISYEPDHSIPDSKGSLNETQAALVASFLLPNQYISTCDNFEDLSLPDDAQDNAVPKEDEINSLDGSSMNLEQSGHISASEICSKDGALLSDTPIDFHMLSDTPIDFHTGSGNLSVTSFEEEASASHDLAEISSNYGQEDPQTMSIFADDSELEVPNPDTQSHGTCFASHAGLNNKASETVAKIELENINDPPESLLGVQECLSPAYCIQRQDQGQESSSVTGSANLIRASAEPLYRQDGPADVQGLPSEEALTCSEKIFPSSISEIEALHAPHQETFTSLTDHISDSVLSMDLTDSEGCLDVSPISMVPFSTPLYETPQADQEITPGLPPLPPTQWWVGKLVESTERPSVAGSGNNSFYIHRDENTQNGSVQTTEALYPSDALLTDDENHKSHVYTEESRVEAVPTCAQSSLRKPSKATEKQSPSAVNGASDTYMYSSPKCLKKAAEESFALAESAGLEADWRTEAMALEWFSQNLREHSNPNSAKLEEEQPQLDHPLEQPRDNSSYDQNQKAGKLKREEEDSLVIGIDKSMLRKVCERNRTEVGAPVHENDTLLEIIRSKSFNLRPADASVRPNFQVAVPKTNLKVAAILEKANTLRQATAGSDDEHDSDSWSE